MILSFEHRHALGGRALACFGGDSSSTQQVSNTDRRLVQAEGSISASEGATVTTIDPGAFTLARQVVDQVPVLTAASSKNLASVLDFARQSNDTAQRQAADAVQLAAQYTRDAYADAQGTGKSAQLLMLLIVAGAVVAIAAFRK